MRACWSGIAAILAALWVAAVPVGAQDDFEVEERGPDFVSEAAVPDVIEIDLATVPTWPGWRSGDLIREIPRRQTHLPPAAWSPAPPIPGAEDELLATQASAPQGADAFITPILSIDGQNYTGVNPADPSADIGANHFITAINTGSGTSVTIYNKSGTILSGPFVLGSTLGGTGDCANGNGDPVVLYDPLADRWLLSEFASAGNRLCVYVSQAANPITGGWLRYEFNTPDFPDYPKYAVWPDAYYVSTNESSPAVYALDRHQMLAGGAALYLRFTATVLAGFPFQTLTPADLDGAAPPAGSPGIFARHRDDEAHNPPGTPNDFLEIWQLHVDWVTPGNSTFTGPTNIAVTDFSSDLCGFTTFSCIPQPSAINALDPLREVVMFRLQYRNFGTHESLAGNFVTNLSPPGVRAGIRWFELRKTGAGGWALFQEGTYTPDVTNRWMGASSMDRDGNFAVGYSVSSSSVFPGLRYAGRLATDPAGTLPQGEATIVNGFASNASNRWGDYFQMGVDPVDDCTFWFFGAYSPVAQWRTRIASFKFTSCGQAMFSDGFESGNTLAWSATVP